MSSKKIGLTKKMRETMWDSAGNLRGDGWKCATCGDHAGWGTHPACERNGRGQLIVWAKDPA